MGFGSCNIRFPRPNHPVGIDLTSTPIPAAKLRIFHTRQMTTEMAQYIILQQPIRAKLFWWLLNLSFKIGRPLCSCFTAAMTSLFSSLFNIYIYIYIYHYHHHHVVPRARISLTLSRHFFLSFIDSRRSSGLHPVSSPAVCIFKLIVLLLLGYMRGSIGVHHLWARPCFPRMCGSSCLDSFRDGRQVAV